MIKKIGYIAIATLLILTTVGFVITRHYCNGELVSVQVDIPADNCCDEEADNCCHNENETFILDIDFTQPVNTVISIFETMLFDTPTLNLTEKLADQLVVVNSLTDPAHPPAIHLFLAKIQSYLL